MVIKEIIERPVELDITGVTLPSIEEIKKLPQSQREADKYWWLRSPGRYSGNIAVVENNGTIVEDGICPDYVCGIRPVFRIANLKSADIHPGSRLIVAGIPATVISGTAALADHIVGYSAYSEDDGVDTPCDYQQSDAGKWLDSWWKKFQNG